VLLLDEDDGDGVLMHEIRMREKGVRKRERESEDGEYVRSRRTGVSGFSRLFRVNEERKDELRGRGKEVRCRACVRSWLG